MNKYEPKHIEKKWQEYWEKNKTYNVENHAEGKENRYIFSKYHHNSLTLRSLCEAKEISGTDTDKLGKTSEEL